MSALIGLQAGFRLTASLWRHWYLFHLYCRALFDGMNCTVATGAMRESSTCSNASKL